LETTFLASFFSIHDIAIHPELDVSVSAQLAVKSIDSLVHITHQTQYVTPTALSLPGNCSVLTDILTVQFKMKHLAAYLLLALAGNESPSASDIKEVLSSVGIDAEDARLEKLLSELEGKNIQEVRLSASNT
jgi:hypothetical protein